MFPSAAMEPTIRNGAIVAVWARPNAYSEPSVGDIIAFQWPRMRGSWIRKEARQLSDDACPIESEPIHLTLSIAF
jgi:hypothetical protein